VNDSSNVYLGVIAVATLLIAIVQIGVLVAAGLLARRLAKLTTDLEQQIKPIFGHLDAIGRDAARAASLATAQVERVDSLFADVTGRVEQGLDTVQASVFGTAKQGAALVSAFRAAFGALRTPPPPSRRRPRADDEDALFI
jgi:uncharacterized protein YoxC